MFQQLDDPDGFAVTNDFRAAVRRRSRRLQRRRRATRVAVLGAIPVIGLATAGLEWRDRMDSVQHVHVANAAGRTADPLAAGGPVTFLIVGVDAQAGADATERGTTTAAGRPDSILLARWEPADQQLRTLALPRDLDLGRGKLDSRTISDLPQDLESELGIHVDHLVAIDMTGFAELAGIVKPRVAIDDTVRDRNSGLALEPGCQALSGREALAYVRSRHLEYLESDGRWSPLDSTGDIGRMDRLTSLVAAILPRIGGLSALDWNDALGVLDRYAVVDDRLSVRELGDWARSISSARVTLRSSSLPLRVPREVTGHETVLHINADTAPPVLAPFGGHVGSSVPIDYQPAGASGPGRYEPAIGAVTAC